MFTHRTLDFANKMRIKINKIDCSSWYTGNHYNLYSNATQTRIHFSPKDSTGSAFCAPPTSHSFVGAEGCSMCAHSNACQQAAAATTTTAMESETSGSGEQNCDNSLFHSTSIAATTNFCAFIQNSALLWTDSGNDVWKYMRHTTSEWMEKKSGEPKRVQKMKNVQQKNYYFMPSNRLAQWGIIIRNSVLSFIRVTRVATAVVEFEHSIMHVCVCRVWKWKMIGYFRCSVVVSVLCSVSLFDQ